MTTALVRTAAYAPWSARTWRDTAFTAAGAALALPTVLLLVLCAIPYPTYAVLAVPALPGLAARCRWR